MISRRIARRGTGFTLIEMAVVLVIIGLLAALTLPFFNDIIKRDKRSTADTFLKQVKDQVIGFALTNLRLPTTAEFNNLGIGTDPYGNTINYAPSSTTTNLTASNILCNSATTTADITVRKDNGGASPSTTANVAFVLYTNGANRLSEIGTSVANTFDYYDPRNYKSITGATNQDYDDSFDFATLNLLKTRVCSAISSTSGTSGPPGSDVSFAANIGDGSSFVIQSAAKTAGTNPINIDANTNSLEFGNGQTGNAFACLWYQGNSTSGSGCVQGNCTWPSGGTVRAYFAFKYSNADTSTDTQDYGEGFNFVLANGNYHTNSTSCGCDREDIGFAGRSGACTNGGTASGGTGIFPPKIGFEIDTYYENSKLDAQSNTGSNRYNHAAIVYFASNSTTSIDDNQHSRSGTTTTVPNTDSLPSSASCFSASPQVQADAGTGNAAGTDASASLRGVMWNTSDHGWLEDANTYYMRIEVTPQTYAGCPGGGTELAIRMWVYGNNTNADANGLAFNDLSANFVDFRDTTTSTTSSLQRYQNSTLYLADNNGMSGKFDRYLYGWTFSQRTGVENTVTISDFGIRIP